MESFPSSLSKTMDWSDIFKFPRVQNKRDRVIPYHIALIMAASLLGRSIVLVRGIGVSSSPVGGSSYIHTSSLLNGGYRQRFV